MNLKISRKCDETMQVLGVQIKTTRKPGKQRP